MSHKPDDLILHTSLLLLQEVVCEMDVEAIDIQALREMIARSAMGITHEDRECARRLAEEVLEQHNFAISDGFYDGDEHNWYQREPVLYDERIAQVWRDGVRQKKSVWMRYRSERPEVTERVVDPWQTSAPYGVGYCHLRQASRKFRFDRISKIELTDQPFEKPSHWKSIALGLPTMPD